MAELPITMTPVVDGIFTDGPRGVRLIATRCGGCDTTWFPQRETCANPACTSPVLAPVELPDRGTLYSYTFQRYQAPPPFRMDNWQPYFLGLVDLGEGVRVMGMLTGVAEADVRIGMEVRLVAEALFVDAQRGAVATYKFAPVRKGDDAA